MQYFDGHNDTLLRLWRFHRNTAMEAFVHGTDDGHIDLPKARAGQLVGGLCAIFIMSDPALEDASPPRVGRERALRETQEMLAILLGIANRYPEALRVCSDVNDIKSAISAGQFAAVPHIEGAEMVDPDLDALCDLYAAGIRSLGLTWATPNAFAHGVPFAFPSTPDIGPGLTSAGCDMVRECNALGIQIDLSHLNEAGFWDVARISTAPLVATHSNAHAIAPHSRNLTDRQLDAIRDTGGLVGINLGGGFLNPDGVRTAQVPLDLVRRHLDHIVSRIGIDHVALGSDFDGTIIPDVLSGAQDLPKITQILQTDYGASEMTKFAHENWFRVLGQSLHGPRM